MPCSIPVFGTGACRDDCPAARYAHPNSAFQSFQVCSLRAFSPSPPHLHLAPRSPITQVHKATPLANAYLN
eukprot:358582-Chlamydomonas_euryale.AAC.8